MGTTHTPSTAPVTKRGLDRAQQCLWYAYGRYDAMESPTPDSTMAWAWECGRAADDYEQGRSFFLPSIKDQFQTWVESL